MSLPSPSPGDEPSRASSAAGASTVPSAAPVSTVPSAAPVLPPVGRTAVAAARVRAHESSRPDRLFDDPLAARFVAAAHADNQPAPAPPGDEGTRRRALAFHVIVRTRFYDDFLLAAGRDGIRQVVLLGAGLDSRAYRLPWAPGTQMYEVDLPPVLEYKRDVLAAAGLGPNCERHPVSADLAGDWPAGLVDAGFRPTAPTAWLAEGLLVYLDDPSATALLRRVTSWSAPGSRLALEGGTAASAAGAGRARPIGVEALWRGGLDGDPAGWLAAAGWRPVGHPLAAIAHGYGRAVGGPSRSSLLTATRP
ncbi:MAG: SAM-dependent methyltransferase [Frankia sp.]